MVLEYKYRMRDCLANVKYRDNVITYTYTEVYAPLGVYYNPFPYGIYSVHLIGTRPMTDHVLMYHTSTLNGKRGTKRNI